MKIKKQWMNLFGEENVENRREWITYLKEDKQL